MNLNLTISSPPSETTLTTTKNSEDKSVVLREVPRVKSSSIEFKLLKKRKPSENSTNDEINPFKI